MGTQVFFAITLATLLVYGAESVSLTITNKCKFTIWPGILTGDNKPQLATTGFELRQDASRTVDAPKPWISGRLWARTDCNRNPQGSLTCATADCGSGQEECNGKGAVPPASLAEFTLEANDKDTYDISLVDGFNLPLSIAPQGGSGDCKPISCSANVNSVCPQDLAVKAGDGRVIACKSACEAYKTPEYCCTASFNNPNTCRATQLSKIFKDQCPDAYSFAYNDQSSTFTCTNPTGYVITFCP